MTDLSQITELLGWVALINIGYLCIATILLMFFRETISSMHSKIFKIDESELGAKYFDFLSHYKIMSLVFTVAPYIALKIMGY